MNTRTIARIFFSIVALAAIVGAVGYRTARADPVIRAMRIALPRWPAGAAPIRAVLISDIHIGSSTMDAARLARIVKGIDALHPDIVLIAGDFIAGHERRDAILGAPMLAPLAGLHPRLGVVAVLGNHDHWTDAPPVRRTLVALGIAVLENEALVRGPLAIGGVGDEFSHHDDVAATMAAMRPLSGARIVLTHSPDIAPELPRDVKTMFAGHTHCGQIVLPIVGASSVPSRFGARYLCGIVREGSQTTLVTGGLGTSVIALRIGAPPDLWIVTFGPTASP